MTGTSASLHMITQLITSKEITGLEADMWLTTLSFIKNPTKDMLKEVKVSSFVIKKSYASLTLSQTILTVLFILRDITYKYVENIIL